LFEPLASPFRVFPALFLDTFELASLLFRQDLSNLRLNLHLEHGCVAFGTANFVRELAEGALVLAGLDPFSEGASRFQ
jgi:hypothetical protein